MDNDVSSALNFADTAVPARHVAQSGDGTQRRTVLAPYVQARYLIEIGGIALIYFGAAKFGFTLAFATRQVTAVWPPTGIAFVVYVLLGYRAWPGIYVGALLANAVSDEPLLTAAGIAVGNTLAGIIGLYLLRRFTSFEAALDRLTDVLGVVGFGAVIGSVVSATNGVANLVLSGIVPWQEAVSVWCVWWVGDGMGVLLLAPLILTWFKQPRLGWRGLRLAELITVSLALVGVCHLAFSGQLVQTTALFRFEYAVFPLIIWTALRFGQRESASAAVLISAFAIWGAIHSRGPFAAGTLDERLMLLEVFIAITAVTALTLGAVSSERRHAERSLQRANDELERRVNDRTAQLAATNKELSAKNEEVEAFVYIVSHDLRAPLVNLQGFSNELEISCRELKEGIQSAGAPAVENRVQSILNEDIPSALRYITASTTKFQRLIDALLTLSRQGRQQYECDEIDMELLVGSTLDAMHRSIEKSSSQISIGSLPPAFGDFTALGQVFSNLIGNALTYTCPGRSVQIEIGGVAENGITHYWVRDNGAGIPASAQRRLFQVFQRFHPTLAPGEGMGLATVKRVVERHRGKVWAESEEGVGTTFHVVLPRAEPLREGTGS